MWEHTSGQKLKFEYIKLLTKASFSFRPKNNLTRISAFIWFPADLQILLICSLKFSLSSISTPRSFTDQVEAIFSFPIASPIFVLSDLPLFRRITWNLSGFTIILLLWSQFIAVSHSDCKIVTSPLSVFAKLHRVLSSAKLWTNPFGIKKKKSLKMILNKIGPKNWPQVHRI